MALDKLVDSAQLDADLESVADAIREKGGTSEALSFPNDFITAIEAIQTGESGGGSGGGCSTVEKDVNFIDYDGTLLYSYTKAEIEAMTSESDLPANPSHTGLVAQGWNWTLAQIKAQLTAMPNDPVLVGQMYVTESGDTEIDVEFQDSVILSPILTIAVNGAVTVDWGDGTATSSVTASNLTTRKSASHTYASVGNYTIKVHSVSGEYTFYCTSSNTILRKNTTGNQNRVYSGRIKAIRVGSGIKALGSYAFGYCYSLETVTMPKSVTTVSNSAFYTCYSLENVVIPSGVTSIGGSAFYTCYSLKNVSIPSSVTSIGDSVFNVCSALRRITIPSGVTSIGSGAFNACGSLRRITIPSGVTSIGNTMFSGCSNLISVTLPSGVTSIGNGAFTNCYNITNITLPSRLTSIGNNALYGCYSLTELAIPSNVTSIGNSTFATCYSLVSITIPNSITSVGNDSFSGCYGVQNYHIIPTTPPTAGTTIFNNIISGCIIYVPYSADHSILNAYKTATNWSIYADYMQEEPQ